MDELEERSDLVIEEEGESTGEEDEPLVIEEAIVFDSALHPHFASINPNACLKPKIFYLTGQSSLFILRL